MTRPVIYKITSKQFENKDLRRKITSDARKYAGQNPGVKVLILREIAIQREPTRYKPLSGRGRGKCAICFKHYNKHETSQLNCPSGSYWETWKDFLNVSKGYQQWE